ncbi:MarR family winged helix-turn-helix transcriptional regulator [Kordiimonas sp. SCSIO 12610]|uniref:MarR family winged helix-turn-helix transcriptional regulator n=1 Tax=Kordiimonas sp. SCSIO 12610 TaxID=2829597 RepID=UPI00210D9239|nr:MarR family winged helix-turn-helix transcriptional regulator [Kordiimonas sp. SCSIO 12610]
MNSFVKNKLKLQAFLPYRLSVLSNRISRAIADRYEEQFQISLPEWRVVAVLGDTPDISAGSVAQKTAMDKVAVSRAVNKLLESGLLIRKMSNEDKRRSILSLSEKGAEIYGQVAPLAIDYENKLLEQLSDEDRTQLEDLLNKLEKIEL